MRLPLPTCFTHPAVFVGLAVLHLYLGIEHVREWLEPTRTFTDLWKSAGAFAGTYYFLALASRGRVPRSPP